MDDVTECFPDDVIECIPLAPIEAVCPCNGKAEVEKESHGRMEGRRERMTGRKGGNTSEREGEIEGERREAGNGCEWNEIPGREDWGE